MGVASTPESLHSVTLSVGEIPYTANIWRGSGTQWRLLSVVVNGQPHVSALKCDFHSCRASLEAAEQLATEVLEGSPGRT